jgi:hypothetical protein
VGWWWCWFWGGRVGGGDSGLKRRVHSGRYTYACLGSMLGKDRFSFNLLASTTDYEIPEIQAYVQAANRTTSGILDVAGVRFSDKSGYATCHLR